MTRVLLVDDEPLVLIGMQSMLDWSVLGYEIIGTARNGAEALKVIRAEHPDVVISDIRMPVLDGLALAEQCRADDDVLPVFIMLTSYEEFDYVKRSMGVGAVEYLVKIDLSRENLTAALTRAREKAEKEKLLRGNAPAAAPATSNLDAYRDRFFWQLYSGNLTTNEEIARRAAELGLQFTAPCYAVALAELPASDQPPEQQVTLSAGVTRMAADILPRYHPCTVTGMDLRHFSVLLPLDTSVLDEEEFAATLQKAGGILYNYFSAPLRWAVGTPVNDLTEISKSRQQALAALPLLSASEPVVFCRAEAKTPLDHRARLVADVQGYIRRNLSSRLSLNDVATVFNFSPSYLSQLFAQSGEQGFVEFVTETRITAAKELMATTDLKVYEISEKLGFESAFYFSKVFKKIEGVSPRDYMQRLGDSHVE